MTPDGLDGAPSHGFLDRAHIIAGPAKAAGDSSVRAHLTQMLIEADLELEGASQETISTALRDLKLLVERLKLEAEAESGHISMSGWERAKKWFCPRPPFC